MTASVHSSKTPTIENEKDRDVESLGKAEDADVSAEDDNSNSEKGPSQWEVTLEKSEDPRSMATWYKWFIVIMVSCGTMCATCAPSMATFAEAGVMKEFDVTRTVAILPISAFVIGSGTGPLLLGPLSEVHGRNLVYRVSFTGFFMFSWVVAFAPNIAVLIVFRFITGLFGSAFLSVTGGTLSDLFTSSEIGNPIMVYSLAPFLGPVMGPVASGFIDQHLNWRWTYHVITIWVFIILIALLFMKETYVPVLLKRKAVRLREETGDQRYHAPMEKENISLLRLTIISCYRPFQLLFYDKMVLLLDTWTALTVGILYLSFQAFPVIFGSRGFSDEFIGLSFLGIGVGVTTAALSQPIWNMLALRRIQKYGSIPPETRLIMGQVGAVLIPIGLFGIAFTTYRNVHWIFPIIASIPFGIGLQFSITSTLGYCFASAFPLFTLQIYDTLGTVGATALVAGLATLFAPLPFIFYKIGARLRAQSKFAAE